MNTNNCNFPLESSALAYHVTHLVTHIDCVSNVHIRVCKFRSPRRLILWFDAPVTFVRRSTVLSALPRGSWSWRPGWIISPRSSSSRSAATWVPSAIPLWSVCILSSALCRFCPPSSWIRGFRKGMVESSRPFMSSSMAAPDASDLGRCLRLCQSIHLVAATDDLWRPRWPPRMIKFWALQRPRSNCSDCMISLPDHACQNNNLFAVTIFQICFIILGLRNLNNNPYTSRSQISTEFLLSERSRVPESTVGPFTRVTEVPKSATFRCHCCICAVLLFFWDQGSSLFCHLRSDKSDQRSIYPFHPRFFVGTILPYEN